ncbi:unnamed protein product [Didymodactylos carnosus]|uniref:ATP-dependent DNA helicase n=1 Tax=Didymodactylos carnosus TaxID=1234261 RepID=A0A8S2GCH9_9BILA|nr:unnamed protein product [Didymodactylos carnosus]CAF3491999.1 unnamed protein product [Didymodactylos carnosus]
METKAFEASDAISKGADEIDMVLNIARLVDGDLSYVAEEIRKLRSVTRGKILKVILETALLSEQQIIEAAKICVEASVDFVKTSTGFSTRGASVKDIELIKNTIGDRAQIKASGGVRSLVDLEAMVKAGATRIGTSTIELINSPKQCVLITGKAGTGKSSLLRHYLETSDRTKYAVLASTGIAAINVGGMTVHRFFSLPTSFISLSTLLKPTKRLTGIVKLIKAIIIDEISMIRPDMIDGMDRILRKVLNSELPFGGMKIVMFGDPYQLPPVIRRDEQVAFEHLGYRSPHFFDAFVFAKSPIHCQELLEIFRQTDREFINILEEVRFGQISSESLYTLNDRKSANISALNEAIMLCARSQQASEHNQRKLNELVGKTYRYEAIVEGEFRESSYPCDKELVLKEGAQVIMVRNDERGR